jgi:hypothetical protein
VTARARSQLLGRSFVHPAFDGLLIGGGLSLAVTLLAFLQPAERGALVPERLGAWLLLAANSAHFAASTVRLYTKPGAVQALPFLSTVFPALSLGVLTLCIAFAETLGAQLRALYLTWSPYHYAAQAYGLGVAYSYRSGCLLAARDKRLLRLTCLLPFFYAFLSHADWGVGVEWLLPEAWLRLPAVANARDGLLAGLSVAIFAAPAALFAWVWRRPSGPMPWIVPMLLVANGVWWVLLLSLQAFYLAAIFHAIQYLAIVMIFHVRDQTARPENRRGPLAHALGFYAASLALGYGLFHCLPAGFVAAGFGWVESSILVAAAINVHHFVVDAYIWHFRPGEGNRRIIDVPEAQPAR